MPRVLAYHRPASIDEALTLLQRESARMLGGGSHLVGRLNSGTLSDVEVVDLQALGLSTITSDADRVRLGAMVTLQSLADAVALPEALRDLARAEEPSTLRTRATVGGIVAGRDAESALLAGLLAADAVVTSVDATGDHTEPLSSLLDAGVAGRLITAIEVASEGRWASSSTGRTPGDTPIVAAIGRRRTDGSVALAVTGVAATPILVDANSPDPASGLEPPSDFRGSADYRRHLAGVHVTRVLDALATV